MNGALDNKGPKVFFALISLGAVIGGILWGIHWVSHQKFHPLHEHHGAAHALPHASYTPSRVQRNAVLSELNLSDPNVQYRYVAEVNHLKRQNHLLRVDVRRMRARAKACEAK